MFRRIAIILAAVLALVTAFGSQAFSRGGEDGGQAEYRMMGRGMMGHEFKNGGEEESYTEEEYNQTVQEMIDTCQAAMGTQQNDDL